MKNYGAGYDKWVLLLKPRKEFLYCIEVKALRRNSEDLPIFTPEDQLTGLT